MIETIQKRSLDSVCLVFLLKALDSRGAMDALRRRAFFASLACRTLAHGDMAQDMLYSRRVIVIAGSGRDQLLAGGVE